MADRFPRPAADWFKSQKLDCWEIDRIWEQTPAANRPIAITLHSPRIPLECFRPGDAHLRLHRVPTATPVRSRYPQEGNGQPKATMPLAGPRIKADRLIKISVVAAAVQL